MMHPYFIAQFAIWQSFFRLIMLAGFVFFLVVAWRYMKAQESLASTLKDAVISLRPKE
jgi:hypothetical protein